MLCASLYSQADTIETPQYNDLSKARLSSIECLATNLYFESRGESDVSNMYIISVVLNRVNDKRFADSICGVVFQRKQFSWVLDGKSDEINDKAQYKRLYQLSEQALINKDFILSTSEGVTHYHTTTSDPYWSFSKRMLYKGVVGNHKFYKWR